MLNWCYHLEISSFCFAKSLARRWLSETQLGFKICSAWPASWHGWCPKWRCSLEQAPRSCPRSWRHGSLGALDGAMWVSESQKNATFQHVWCWGVRVVWFSNSALLLLYKKKINIIGYPNIKDFEFPSPPKPYSLYCGIWKPRYSGTIT